jgi:DNA-binding CsgD family transcriptional regulator
MQILRLIAEGAHNNEIADRLVLSPNTVKTYLRRIMDKLEVDNRQEAVAKAIRSGAIPERRERRAMEYSSAMPPLTAALLASPGFERRPNGTPIGGAAAWAF